MQLTSETVERLVEQFAKLPSIGRKTAHRLSAYVLKMPREEVIEFAKALVAVKDKVVQCKICHNVSDTEICGICTSNKRNKQLICVVEESNDVMALERTEEFKGLYHVLGGVISPLDGIGPDDLKIRELVARVAEATASPMVAEAETLPASTGIEVILAMNPTVEGDTTALYISGLLKPFGVRITQIARGLPTGSALEFADESTLSRALEGRIHLST